MPRAKTRGQTATGIYGPAHPTTAFYVATYGTLLCYGLCAMATAAF